jgi:hypothetical protein
MRSGELTEVAVPPAKGVHLRLEESRTRGCWWRPVQEIRIRGPKMMCFDFVLLFVSQKSYGGLRPSSSAHVR